MNIYRLDRRFALQGIGINLLISGIALSVAFVMSALWLALALLALAVVLFVRAILLWVRPPAVARTDDAGVTLGGRLTVKPVAIAWKQVVDVSYDEQRVYLDRGEDKVLVFPLAFAGSRGPELLRDIYDRLNTAHGYRRFDLG